jgi:hypothetical protein
VRMYINAVASVVYIILYLLQLNKMNANAFI